MKGSVDVHESTSLRVDLNKLCNFNFATFAFCKLFTVGRNWCWFICFVAHTQLS